MGEGLAGIESLAELARVLRQLRRREARRRGRPELTYREIAAETGWSIGAIGGYLSGTLLPSTIRFDVLIRLLGATPAEQGALATARDRIAERPSPAAADLAEPAVAGPGQVPSGPRLLPADVCNFTGRVRQLAELDGLLAEPGLCVATLYGTAGVGKTALAVHWAHRVADRFPDGQLYANLRGFDVHGAPVAPMVVARGFLVALGVPAGQIPVGTEEVTALYRSTLATRRILVLLDNALDPDQVRPLLSGAAGSVVVTTSRDAMAGLVATSGARPLKLDLLSPAEAEEMLARRLGRGRVVAEPRAAAEIAERCSRLPLALAVAAARATIDGLPLASLAAELGEAGRRLDALGTGDASADVRSVFSWSYRALPAPAARMFRLLGLHPGPDIGVAAAASLAGLDPTRARRVLMELTRVNLLTEHSPGRFSHHDLLRAYAFELGGTRRGTAAVRRMVDHYCGTAYTSAVLLDPRREVEEPSDPAPTVRPEPLADHAAALAWFTAEYPILLSIIRIAADHRFDVRVCQLAKALGVYQQLEGRWAQWVETLNCAADTVQRLGDRTRQAWFHRTLIAATARTGDYAASLHHGTLAIDLYRALADDVGQARCHRSLCLTFEHQGNHRQALQHAIRSRDLLQGTGDQARLAYAFNSVGWYQALVGDFAAALENCRHAVGLLQACGDVHGAATTWDSIGYAHHNLGRYREAVECYERALALFRATHKRYYEARTLHHLGDTLLAVGDHDAARAAWRDALVILELADVSEAAEIRVKLTGTRRVRQGTGQ
jgi:tetratricopeptide (TPR) repeat protein